MSALENRWPSGPVPPAWSGRMGPFRTGSPTLLDLVAALCEETADDQEVVSAVIDLLRSRRVRLAEPPAAPAPGL